MTEFLFSFGLLAGGMIIGAAIAFALVVIALNRVGPKF